MSGQELNAGTRALHLTFKATAALARAPAGKRVLGALLRRLAKSDGSGPDEDLRERSSSYVCAAAFDARGEPLAAATMGELDGFDFTARILAWSADTIARGGLARTGVTGPVQAFGRTELLRGHAESGFELLDTDRRNVGSARYEVALSGHA
jgi:short subunit dehydrogenase-like uncharacterized protein